MLLVTFTFVPDATALPSDVVHVPSVYILTVSPLTTPATFMIGVVTFPGLVDGVFNVNGVGADGAALSKTKLSVPYDPTDVVFPAVSVDLAVTVYVSPFDRFVSSIVYFHDVVPVVAANHVDDPHALPVQ